RISSFYNDSHLPPVNEHPFHTIFTLHPPPSTLHPLTKATARRILAASRFGLPRSYRQWAAQQIVERILDTHEFRTASEIHCYWPMDDSSEIDTQPLITAALNAD